MKIKLWGTRGTIPCVEPDTMRYGGNTSCVEVRSSDGSLLVLDAGSGIKRLGATVEPDISRVDILLTHLHMDHILGLGFFGPVDQPEKEIHIWGPPSVTMILRARLRRYLSPPIFPINIRDFRSEPTFHDAPRGKFNIGGLEIMSDLIFHPGSTVGYRITEGNTSIAYLPDHEPAMGASRVPEDHDYISGYELASNVDILIHDAQFSAEEYTTHVGWGHSSIPHAIEFAKAAGVKKLVTFHHDPMHSDAQIDQLMEKAQSTPGLSFELTPGVEGSSFQLGP